MDQQKQKEYRIIRREDPDYPEKMKHLGSMPDELYVIGDLPDEGKPSVGIVGARLCSPYGHQTARLFGYELAKHGVQIISGMAAGIDGYAQEGALDAGGRSFAVLGSGVDVCYPASNRKLYSRLKTGGGILSEFPPGSEPLPYHFPTRNRLISALSDLVIVVEAKARSGSLITIDFALTQGRTVFAVPGRVGDALSDGCNYLISQGAGIAYAPEAILEELKIMEDTASFAKNCERRAAFRKKKASELMSDARIPQNAKTVYKVLDWENALTSDDITARLTLPLPEILSSLMVLVRSGYASEPIRGSFLRRQDVIP